MSVGFGDLEALDDQRESRLWAMVEVEASLERMEKRIRSEEEMRMCTQLLNILALKAEPSSWRDVESQAEAFFVCFLLTWEILEVV